MTSHLLTLFDAAVAAHAGEPAISDGTTKLSYQELSAAAGDVAADLTAHGVRPGHTVALRHPRGVGLVTAVLGVLRAGAAYLPLDVDDPAARVDAMIADAGAAAVLTADGIEPGPGSSDDSAEGVACVLFTSGSTGTPKGVRLSHESMAWFATTPSIPVLGPGDRMAQAASPGFDTFTFELWRALASGAEVVVTPSLRDMVGGELRRELRQRRITAMLAPAAVLNHVVRFDRNSFGGLRLLCSGGDVLLPATARALREAGFDGTLMNLYGPTETTVAATGFVVPDDASDIDPSGIPIGAPLEGATALVIDPDGTPVADGEVGELLIGGAGVGLGYIGLPQQTAERFVTTPDGETVYRTGDLVCRRADGVLEYRGRTDHQVKIMGRRVEPGEVERTLRHRDGIAEAAVTAVGPEGDRRLVAFLVLEEQVALRELRTAVEADLPRQFVPQEMVVVDRIETDRHGKRDWEQLITLYQDRERGREEFEPPRDDTERFLCDLWEDLLTIERVGAGDDFFELGGHSLLAVRVRSVVRKKLGVDLPPESVFEFSVLRDLSTAIDTARADAARTDAARTEQPTAVGGEA